ncbi:hypothetical protein CDD83_3010 [Cordyceps sp. RAO-2017]|nr:hypothetical protein CDD83_3010 [Cordyceps sp. RAO-2017]
MTVSLGLAGAAAALGLGGGGAASSPDESEFSMMACDRTRPPVPPLPPARGLVDGGLAAAALALELPSRRLAWASCALAFLGLGGSGFELDLDMLSPLALALSPSTLEPSSREPELSSARCTLILGAGWAGPLARLACSRLRHLPLPRSSTGSSRCHSASDDESLCLSYCRTALSMAVCRSSRVA